MNFMNPGYSFFNRFPPSTFAPGKQKTSLPAHRAEHKKTNKYEFFFHR